MKKIYSMALLLFVAFQTNAQTYTITQTSNEPVVGDSYTSVIVDTNSTALPIGISGTGVTWNFSPITAYTTALNTFSTAASNTNSANYPGTNLVQFDSTRTTFFKTSTGMLEVLGVESSQFILNYNAGSATMATYPMTYGYTNTDNTAGGTMTVNMGGGMAGTFTATINTSVDGAGTVDINSGSTVLTNCVRVKSYQQINFDLASPLGALSGTIDQYLYSYYHSSSKFPVFTVNYNIVDVPSASVHQEQSEASILSTILMGVKESKLNDVIFKAYPNPAQNEVNIHFVIAQQESYTIEILNAFGQIVKSISLYKLQAGMYNEPISTADLAAGIYTIKVIGNNKQGSEKLIIQK